MSYSSESMEKVEKVLPKRSGAWNKKKFGGIIPVEISKFAH